MYIGCLENNIMCELSMNEVQEVNGGILPLIVAIVVADAGLIGGMISAGYW
jgi:lactobin A/cerein 7B family class IIb bacteriocin